MTVSTAVWARREIRERRAGLQFDRFNKRESSGIVSTDALFIDLKVGTHLSKYDSQTGTEARTVVSDLDQRASRLQCRRPFDGIELHRRPFPLPATLDHSHEQHERPYLDVCRR